MNCKDDEEADILESQNDDELLTRSFSRQCLWTGIHSCCISISVRFTVLMHLLSRDVWTSSKRIPLLDSIWPATRASNTPSSVKGVSCQPINRLSRFQVLWPWRRKQRLYAVSLLIVVNFRCCFLSSVSLTTEEVCTLRKEPLRTQRCSCALIHNPFLSTRDNRSTRLLIGAAIAWLILGLE